VITVVQGTTVKGRWGQWFRHDKVYLDGKPLEGSVKVRRKYYGRLGHRVETVTLVGMAGVTGYNVAGWFGTSQVDRPKPHRGEPRCGLPVRRVLKMATTKG
jgi:hypothetical protein